MGGKNAIIVDDDADLDEAVVGVVKSAFGYQGQKCSACSRVIVLDAVYDTFLERLVEATRSLKVGPAEDPATSVSAVIDDESFERIRKYIAIGREKGREALAVDVGPLGRGGLLRRPAHLRRRAARRPAGPGGNLRARAGGDAGTAISTRRFASPTAPTTR